MKALVLAAGRGSRIDRITRCQNKCMLTIDGQPLLEKHLQRAADVGVSEILLVIGYRGASIRDYFGTEFAGVPIHYVEQLEQRGLVHAIETAADRLTEDFFLMLGDEYFINPRHLEMAAQFRNGEYFAICGVLEEQDPASIRKTYSVIEDQNGRVHRVIEKPRRPFTGLKGTGNCIFRKEILDYIEFTPIHYLRKEKELPGLIQEAVDDGEKVHSFRYCDKYLNVNQYEELEGFAGEHELALG